MAGFPGSIYGMGNFGGYDSPLRGALSSREFDDLVKAVAERVSKADTITQATGLLWYDLRPIVQLLYPFKELIPRISRLPRVPGDGGNAYHWKRITAINLNNLSVGVSEGNRGGRIAIDVQDQTATYKTLGLESDVTFEARLGAMNLIPDALGNSIQSNLRSLMVGEEQTLLLGNASTALGVTPTPTLAAGGSGSAFAAGSLYVRCVALSGLGWLNSSVQNGVPGQITRTNADGSVDTYGGGSAQPSAEASVTVTAGQNVTATVAPVAGAVAYAWYWSQTAGGELLGAITQSNQVILSGLPAGTQPITALQVSGAYADNSTNALLPDGVLSQIFGGVFGSAPGTAMATNQTLPNGVSMTESGALVMTLPAGNSGLTFSGSNIEEFDALLRAAYDQYKLGFDRILMSAADVTYWTGEFFNTSANSPFRFFATVDQATGLYLAGQSINAYRNKVMGNTLEIEVHPYVPPGTIIFWSDRVPYELSGVPNILEAHVRMDYYQIQWPWRSRRYEYGVYVDEVFTCYFCPAFAVINNVNPPTGVPTVN